MKPKKRDMVLILAVLAFSAALWGFLHPGEPGAYAVVTHRGSEIGRYSLTEDRSIPIGSEDYNIITISDGEVSVSDANCGDHTCIRTGRISREGQRIICLPHELVVEIIGGDISDLDAATH